MQLRSKKIESPPETKDALGDEPQPMDVDEHRIVCTGRCGVALCEKRSMISYDASSLFVPSGSMIRQFSLKTGEAVNELTVHQSPVVSIVPCSLNKVQNLSCSSDGLVARWDSTDCSVISEFRLLEKNDSRSIEVLLASADSPFCLYVVSEKTANAVKNSLFLTTVQDCNESPNLLSDRCTSKSSLYAMASKSDVIAWIEQDSLCITHCNTPGNVQKIRLRCKPSCLCVHPTQELVAVGSLDGEIFVYSAPFTENSNAMKLHWHTLAVGDLHLSANFLYSVGSEGVLVRWDLESDDKQFLPRLGMPIKRLAVAANEKYVVCSHSDNTISVIEAPNKVHCTIQGLIQRSYFNDQPSDLGMLYDPHGNLALSGKPGQIQFYNLQKQKQTKVIDVTGENLATDFKLQYHHMKGINSEIILADFSPDGVYMATVEYKAALTTMCKLKFWKWNEEANNYEINTNVLMPHLRHRLRACKIAYVNGQYFCITTADKSFKVWTVVDGGESTFWQCIEEYDFRAMSCNNVALSEDHSILAVSFNHMITLWQLGESSLRGLGEICAKGEPHLITAMEFGRLSSSNILLVATRRSLSAWDLLSLDRLWTSQTILRRLVVDPKSGNVAALVMKPSRQLVVFSPEKGLEKPLCEAELDPKDDIRCGIFVPERLPKCSEISWQSSSSLLLMGRRDKMFHIVMKKDEGEEKLDANILKAGTNYDSLLTPFGSHLLAERRITDKSFTLNVEQFRATDSQVIDKLLQTPSHVMPSAKLLVDSFLRAFLDIDEREDEAEGMQVEPAESHDSDSDDDLPVKRVKVEPVVEADLIEKMQNDCRLEKLKLAKIKDYNWLGEALAKS